MNKQEFLSLLENALNGLPQEDINERLSFYGEMIDDSIEDGLPEEEAVSKIGSVDDIVYQIVDEIPLTKIVKKKIKLKREFSVLEIVLLCLSFPVWGSVLISILAVIFSLYVSFWAVVVSLWAVFASFLACGLGGMLGGILFILTGNSISGVAVIAGGLVCFGLGILMFYVCKAATQGTVLLLKKIILGIKKCFFKKEGK